MISQELIDLVCYGTMYAAVIPLLVGAWLFDL